MEPLSAIAWDAPWFRLVAAHGRGVRTLAGLPATLNGLGSPTQIANGRPVRFIPQAGLPTGCAYEAHIAATGEVPTRENLHDLFNALVWHACPRTKVMLNTRQAQVIGRAGVGAVRGPVRDAATLFDENGLLLVTEDAGLIAALRGHDWHEAFVIRRAAWGGQAVAWVFGHALMEKLIQPWKRITAHAWHVALPAGADLAAIDAATADSLMGGLRGPDAFLPLPVLGIPGWWPGNAVPGFYEDTAVFRPARPRQG